MPESDSLSLRIVRKDRSHWENKHQNFRQRVAGLIDVWNPELGEASPIDGLKATVSGLQELIERAADEARQLRPLGSGWSLSRLAATTGQLLNTKPLNWIFDLRPESLSTEYTGRAEDLVYVQCGTSISQINQYLEKRKRSLKTSGASNGQTIAGAISTGTHGSAFRLGAMQDCVVGIHLILGPSRQIWLEPETRPVVSSKFADRIEAELVRHSSLFEAALVGLGSMGLIHAVLLETEPIYLLEAHRQRLPWDDTLRRAVNTMKFGELPLPREDPEPFHFQVVVNPHDLGEGAYVGTMYKLPYQERGGSREPDFGKLGPGDDLLHVIGTITDLVSGAVPAIVNEILASEYGTYSGRVGTHGEQFGSTSLRGGATGVGIGVPLEQSADLLDTVLSVHEEEGPFAGVFALRFVRGSSGTLAFTRYDTTCVLDIDGVDSDRSRAFLHAVWDRLDEKTYSYTMHWGKANDLTEERIRASYGEDVGRWLNARQALLDEHVRPVFSSPFLVGAGLAGSGSG